MYNNFAVTQFTRIKRNFGSAFCFYDPKLRGEAVVKLSVDPT